MSANTAIRETRQALKMLEMDLPKKNKFELKRILTLIQGLHGEEEISTETVTPQFMLKDSLRLYPMSQSALADKLAVSKSVVSDLINGRRTITIRWAKRLGKVLHLNYKAFL